jgi:superfamily II RNA helicase
MLCATTTLAQGINFPVSSVFLATHLFPYGVPMTPREFWNLAGRAGRFNQDSVGVVGIAEANRGAEIARFVSDATCQTPGLGIENPRRNRRHHHATGRRAEVRSRGG